MYLNGTNGIAVAHEVPTGIRFTVYDMPGFTGRPMTVNTVEQLEAYARAFGISPGMALKHAVDSRRLDLPSAATWSGLISGKALVPKSGLAQTAPPQAIHQAPSIMWFYVMDGPPDKKTKAVIDSLEALSSYTVWVNAQIEANVKLSQDALGHAKSKGWLDELKYYSWIDFTYNPAKYSAQAVQKPTWIEEILNAFKGKSGAGTNWVIIGGIAVVAVVAAVALAGRKPAGVQPSQ